MHLDHTKRGWKLDSTRNYGSACEPRTTQRRKVSSQPKKKHECRGEQSVNAARTRSPVSCGILRLGSVQLVLLTKRQCSFSLIQQSFPIRSNFVFELSSQRKWEACSIHIHTTWIWNIQLQVLSRKLFLLTESRRVVRLFCVVLGKCWYSYKPQSRTTLWLSFCFQWRAKSSTAAMEIFVCNCNGVTVSVIFSVMTETRSTRVNFAFEFREKTSHSRLDLIVVQDNFTFSTLTAMWQFSRNSLPRVPASHRLLNRCVGTRQANSFHPQVTRCKPWQFVDCCFCSESHLKKLLKVAGQNETTRSVASTKPKLHFKLKIFAFLLTGFSCLHSFGQLHVGLCGSLRDVGVWLVFKPVWTALCDLYSQTGSTGFRPRADRGEKLWLVRVVSIASRLRNFFMHASMPATSSICFPFGNVSAFVMTPEKVVLREKTKFCWLSDRVKYSCNLFLTLAWLVEKNATKDTKLALHTSSLCPCQKIPGDPKCWIVSVVAWILLPNKDNCHKSRHLRTDLVCLLQPCDSPKLISLVRRIISQCCKHDSSLHCASRAFSKYSCTGTHAWDQCRWVIITWLPLVVRRSPSTPTCLTLGFRPGQSTPGSLVSQWLMTKPRVLAISNQSTAWVWTDLHCSVWMTSLSLLSASKQRHFSCCLVRWFCIWGDMKHSEQFGNKHQNLTELLVWCICLNELVLREGPMTDWLR